MTQTVRDALCSRLAEYDRLMEVGIGSRTGLAGSLAAHGVDVTATDRVPRETPPGVAFVRDDITAPDSSIYADADALYALRFPPELHRPALALARETDAELVFTTLGGDPATIPATPETLPGVTLYRADSDALHPHLRGKQQPDQKPHLRGEHTRQGATVAPTHPDSFGGRDR